MKLEDKIGIGIGIGVILGGLALIAGLAPDGDNNKDLRTKLSDGIKTVVRALNNTIHRKNWGRVALDELARLVLGALPEPFHFLLTIVYQVEREAIAQWLAKSFKHDRALALALAH